MIIYKKKIYKIINKKINKKIVIQHKNNNILIVEQYNKKNKKNKKIKKNKKNKKNKKIKKNQRIVIVDKIFNKQ